MFTRSQNDFSPINRSQINKLIVVIRFYFSLFVFSSQFVVAWHSVLVVVCVVSWHSFAARKFPSLSIRFVSLEQNLLIRRRSMWSLLCLIQIRGSTSLLIYFCWTFLRSLVVSLASTTSCRRSIKNIELLRIADYLFYFISFRFGLCSTFFLLIASDFHSFHSYLWLNCSTNNGDWSGKV